MDAAEVEIYRQRYETFRHLDRLRWQMLPVAGGAGAVILAFARQGATPEWWAFVIVGVLLAMSGWAMWRIGQGINKNGAVLCKWAAVVGDTDIPPPPAKWFESVAARIAVTIIGLGVVCILLAILTCTTTNESWHI